jgi:hypothetical protein
MKKVIFTLLSLFLFYVSFSQSLEEGKIRELENAMKDAFLKRDTITLFKILSPVFVVNSPFNRVLTMEDLKNNLRKGGGDTLSFEKTIEKITFTNNIAIVMGQETRKVIGEAVNAGKTFQRRFTDIWMKNKEDWLLVARQATVFLFE